jgi:hypothetical protein
MYLTSNIPYFKCWVRKEFTNGHQKYHGEYVHALAVAVTTIPDRCLSFQVIFTGCEADDGSQPNVHGGAMWAVCRLQRWLVTSPFRSGLKGCRLIWPSLGTVVRTTTGSSRLKERSLHPGCARSTTSSTPVGICLRLIMLRVMFPKILPNTNRAMCSS